jgi:hypothetical protein
MNAEFPVVVGFTAFTIGCLANRHNETAGWQWNRSTKGDSASVADRFDLASDIVNVLVVFTSQFDDGHSGHSIISQRQYSSE